MGTFFMISDILEAISKNQKPLFDSTISASKNIAFNDFLAIRDARGYTAFHLAAEAEDSYYLQILLKEWPRRYICRGLSPLHCAVRKSQIKNIKLLLNNGADINHKDNCGYTPLHEAISQSASFDTVKYLLKRDADSNTRHHNDRTPLDSAITLERLDVITCLLEYGFDIGRMYTLEQQKNLFQSFKERYQEHAKNLLIEYMPIDLGFEEIKNAVLEKMSLDELVQTYKQILGRNEVRVFDHKALNYINHLQQWITLRSFPEDTMEFINPLDMNYNEVTDITQHPGLFLLIPGKSFNDTQIYLIPKGKTRAEVINKVLTSLLYEARKSSWLDKKSYYRKSIIDHLNPTYKEYGQQDLERMLKRREERARDYFAETLSDSDGSDDENDEDNSFRDILDLKRIGIQLYKRDIGTWSQEGVEVDDEKVNGPKSREDKLLNKNHRSDRANLEKFYFLGEGPGDRDKKISQAKNDLKVLNRHVKNGMPIEKAVAKVKTTFYVALYRGVGYTLDWKGASRRAHRAADEIHLPYYSSSVYNAVQFNFSKEYNDEKYHSAEMQALLDIVGSRLKQMLLSMREDEKHPDCEYSFDNLAEYAQCKYSKGYADFHTSLQAGGLREYRGKYFLNSKNPFVSTGARPYHATRYAFGAKCYDSNMEENRLRPRWKASGRAERPYVGKMYISLHPLTDFGQDGPYYVPKLIYEGKVTIEEVIVKEREVTFPGFIEAERVVDQYIATYPSFHKPYQNYYLKKYGLDEEIYNLLAKVIKNSAPHSNERRYIQRILTNWLCAFYEDKLIQSASNKAAIKNGILVYQDVDGSFSMSEPKIGLNKGDANKAMREDIKLYRAYRRET